MTWMRSYAILACVCFVVMMIFFANGNLTGTLYFGMGAFISGAVASLHQKIDEKPMMEIHQHFGPEKDETR
jgi:hypothetical protein